MAITKEMIFGIKTPKEEKEVNVESDIKQVEVHKMVDYREEQPFSPYTKEKFEQLKDSILRIGVLSPVIVRKIENQRYEILAGHNRVRCVRELGMETVLTRVLDVDDNNARLIMLETNLYQRDDIPPVEKGIAYKMQLETLKKIKEEGGVPEGHLKSIEELSNGVEDSQTTIKRYIRLTELIKPLQDKVNGLEQLSIKAGVEISYISKEEQAIINKVLDEKNAKLTVIQAEYLREIKGTITEESVKEIFSAKNKDKQIKFSGKLKKNTYQKYKSKFTNDDEFDALVDRLLSEYFEQNLDY